MEEDNNTTYNMVTYDNITDDYDKLSYIYNYIRQNEEVLKETRIDHFRFKLSTIIFPIISAALAVKCGINGGSVFDTIFITGASLPGMAGAYYYSQTKAKRDNAQKELEILKKEKARIKDKFSAEEVKRKNDLEKIKDSKEKMPEVTKYLDTRIEKVGVSGIEEDLKLQEHIETTKKNIDEIRRSEEILKDIRVNIEDYIFYYNLGCLDLALTNAGYSESEIEYAKENIENILIMQINLELK